MGAVDTGIPDRTYWMILVSNALIIYLVAICIFSPIFILAGVALCVGGATLGHFYVKAQVSIKREMSVAQAPVLAVFGSVVSGLGMRFFLSFPTRL
jgi:hypothetical protein